MKRIAALLLIAQAAWAGPAFVDFDLGLVFPAELGGLAYDRTEKYSNEDFGYSVFYRRGETFEASATIYTLGRTAIPDGHAGDGINLVVQSVEGLLKRDQEQGAKSALRKRGTAVSPAKGRIQFASTVFQYEEPRLVDGVSNAVQRIHAVYVTGQRSRFIKLDFAFDLVENAAAGGMSQKMVEELIGMLSKTPDEEALLMAACDALILDPCGHGGRTAAQRVLAKTQTMDNLNVYPFLFAWPDGYSKPKTADLLVAAYFAGMLQVVVPQKLDVGGEYEGFLALLKAYEAMRAKDEIEALPQLDEWLKVGDKKALLEQLRAEAYGAK